MMGCTMEAGYIGTVGQGGCCSRGGRFACRSLILHVHRWMGESDIRHIDGECEQESKWKDRQQPRRQTLTGVSTPTPLCSSFRTLRASKKCATTAGVCERLIRGWNRGQRASPRHLHVSPGSSSCLQLRSAGTLGIGRVGALGALQRPADPTGSNPGPVALPFAIPRSVGSLAYMLARTGCRGRCIATECRRDAEQYAVRSHVGWKQFAVDHMANIAIL
ncbi:hypothetical protein DFH27DRAFT_144121 [Peziza echinospora]|nr:hypothetical protein DFH27DRAFT_144121 [Peziza echinospora]